MFINYVILRYINKMGSITLNPQVYEKVKKQADKEGRSVANFLTILFVEKYEKEGSRK